MALDRLDEVIGEDPLGPHVPQGAHRSGRRLLAIELRDAQRAAPQRLACPRGALGEKLDRVGSGAGQVGSDAGSEWHRVHAVAELAGADHLRDDLQRALARVRRLAPAPVRDRELHLFAGAERDAVQRLACLGT